MSVMSLLCLTFGCSDNDCMPFSKRIEDELVIDDCLFKFEDKGRRDLSGEEDELVIDDCLFKARKFRTRNDEI